MENPNIQINNSPFRGPGGKISNNELTALGINDVKILESFSRVANGLLKHGVMGKPEILANLEALIDDPMPYALKKGGKFKNLAESIIELRKDGKFIKQQRTNFKLKEEIADFPVWGLEHIEVGALAQMKTAIKLPVAVAGALMPDAHQGYGLPIGGVLATTVNTIIPFAVGVDIACRMCLSIFDLPAEAVDTETAKLQNMLVDHTYFGIGCTTKSYHDSSLFDSKTWSETKVIRSLKDKAYASWVQAEPGTILWSGANSPSPMALWKVSRRVNIWLCYLIPAHAGLEEALRTITQKLR